MANAVNMFGSLALESTQILFRRALKFLESLGNVDSAGRQRVTLDSITAGQTLAAVTTVSTVSSVTNIAATAGLDHRQFADNSRIAYNTGIRSQLTF